MYIILLGAPGSGKGTQAINIAHKLNLVHVATGDLFRQAIAQGTELGMRAKVYLDKGALVSDEITIEMVLERLVAPDCQPGVELMASLETWYRPRLWMRLWLEKIRR